ncbi:hypothetical protein [Saccharothrix sp. HUAS TT1]|uniref:hypothetical protein n=1 Tax=unclassified Saccharothrix TaxID=2593673 RepID=UPI00345BF509
MTRSNRSNIDNLVFMHTGHLLLTLATTVLHLGLRHREQAAAWSRRHLTGLMWDAAAAHLGPLAWAARAALQVHLARRAARRADLDAADGLGQLVDAVGLPAELVDVAAHAVDALRLLARRARRRAAARPAPAC